METDVTLLFDSHSARKIPELTDWNSEKTPEFKSTFKTACYPFYYKPFSVTVVNR